MLTTQLPNDRGQNKLPLGRSTNCEGDKGVHEGAKKNTVIYLDLGWWLHRYINV